MAYKKIMPYLIAIAYTTFDYMPGVFKGIIKLYAIKEESF